MINAFLFGLLASSSLLMGGIISSQFTLSKKLIGMILGFGAGTLISAISYELIFESVKMGKYTGFPAIGLFSGAAIFFFADMAISRLNAKNTTGSTASSQSNLVVPMVLAIILDGIPESIVIGLGMLKGGTVSLSMLVAVFISNLPESLAGSSGMKSGGWPTKKIIYLWLFIAIVCSLSTVAGFTLFNGVSEEWMAFILAFAGGAILMMLSNSMIPEAYEHGGKLAGVFTVLGFFLAVSIIMLEGHA